MAARSVLSSFSLPDSARLLALTGLAALALSALLPRLRDALLGPAPRLPAELAPDVRRRAERGRLTFAIAPFLPVALLRLSYDAEARRDAPAPGAAPVDERETTTPGAAAGAPPLRARLYTPRGAPPAGPLLIYVHGGGYTIGSLASHAPTCRALAAALGWRVLAVTYRRAPEHAYPAAALDVLAAYRHVASAASRGAAAAAEFGLDAAAPRIVVAGDSAGGQLALELGLRLRDEAREAAASAMTGGAGAAATPAAAAAAAPAPVPAPVLLAPIYPVINFFSEFPSKTNFADGYGALTGGLARLFRAAYVWPSPEAAARNRCNAYLNPDLQEDLSGLPPILLATAQFDMLHDEGVHFVETARARGAAAVEHLEIRGNVHACVQNLSRCKSNRDALAAVAARIKALVEGD
jgi:acetyl esterase